MPRTAKPSGELQRVFPVEDYDLAATLNSGQAFRWSRESGGWTGVLGRRWVRLNQSATGIEAQVAEPVNDWRWLADYLQLEVPINGVLATFPADECLLAAVGTCRGLRLLRQESWECLASFILSSTKQIVQIRQIIGRLCAHHGAPVRVPAGARQEHSFPTAAAVACISERELRSLGMGFRAPYLAKAARLVANGEIRLNDLDGMGLVEARAALMNLPGVGRKIADCVLLFATRHTAAFPVDVWILKSLRELYFGSRPASLREVERFAETHFGPNAGLAQQYLFHAARLRAGRVKD